MSQSFGAFEWFVAFQFPFIKALEDEDAQCFEDISTSFAYLQGMYRRFGRFGYQDKKTDSF
jgi:hypothetical protein